MAKETKSPSSAQLYAKLLTIKDSSSSEARKLRQQIRALGISVRELKANSEKPAKATKKAAAPVVEVKKKSVKKVAAPVRSASRKSLRVTADDEDEALAEA